MNVFCRCLHNTVFKKFNIEVDVYVSKKKKKKKKKKLALFAHSL